MLRKKRLWILAALLLLTASLAWSQRERMRRPRPVFDFSSNPEVDERKFTFVRVKFNMKNLRNNQVWEPPWAHDIPRAERHLMQILKEFTGIQPNDEGIVLTLDDPEIFKYPFAYICEVGFWDPTEAEMEGFREYIKRGGFMIVDDFGDNWWWADDWRNFESIMKRAFPDRDLKQVDVSHPIFHALLDMKTIDFPNYRGNGKYYVLDDDRGNVSMVVNFDNDIGDYWEWSGTGYLGVDLTNEAFKLGVNYIIYAFAH
jgi:hypothetical protein